MFLDVELGVKPRRGKKYATRETEFKNRREPPQKNRSKLSNLLLLDNLKHLLNPLQLFIFWVKDLTTYPKFVYFVCHCFEIYHSNNK